MDARLAVLDGNGLMIAGSWNMARARQTVSNYDQGSETAGLFAMRYRKGPVRDFWMKGYLEYPALDTLLGSGESYRFTQAMQKSNGRMVLPDYLSLLRLQPWNGRFRLVGETYASHGKQSLGIGTHPHGTEFIECELLATPTHAPLTIKPATGTLYADRRIQAKQQGGENYQSQERKQQIKKTNHLYRTSS